MPTQHVMALIRLNEEVHWHFVPKGRIANKKFSTLMFMMMPRIGLYSAHDLLNRFIVFPSQSDKKLQQSIYRIHSAYGMRSSISGKYSADQYQQTISLESFQWAESFFKTLYRTRGETGFEYFFDTETEKMVTMPNELRYRYTILKITKRTKG